MSRDLVFDGVIASARAAARHPLPLEISRHHSFVVDLGFDSMSIARLALALEDEFDQAFLLDEWIGEQPNPESLTVDSLCRYVESMARRDHAPAAV